MIANDPSGFPASLAKISRICVSCLVPVSKMVNMNTLCSLDSQQWKILFAFTHMLIFSQIFFLQILSSQHILLPPSKWVRLQPPSQITSSPRAQRVRCQEERQPQPAAALQPSSAMGSMKTSSPSTAPSWPPWWWAWWLTLSLRGQSIEKNDTKSSVVGKGISPIGFFVPQKQYKLGQRG